MSGLKQFSQQLLCGTHYRTLLRLEKPSAPALERQVGTLHFERLLASLTKSTDDTPTIGLVLCSEKSGAVVKYSVSVDQQQLFAAKYLPYLPFEEELKRELERERAEAVAKLCKKGAGHE